MSFFQPESLSEVMKVSGFMTRKAESDVYILKISVCLQ